MSELRSTLKLPLVDSDVRRSDRGFGEPLHTLPKPRSFVFLTSLPQPRTSSASSLVLLRPLPAGRKNRLCRLEQTAESRGGKLELRSVSAKGNSSLGRGRGFHGNLSTRDGHDMGEGSTWCLPAQKCLGPRPCSKLPSGPSATVASN